VLDSNFSIALVSGFVGAYAGAAAAQRVIERSKRRDDLTKEMRNTNAAIIVAFSMCNAALALKKQHVKPMHELFHKTKAELEEFLQARASGRIQGTTPYNFTADLRMFPSLEVPLDSLKELVYHRVAAYGRAVALVSVIEQTLVGIRNSILRRDQFVQRVQGGAIPDEHLVNYYFGRPLPGGSTNQEYPDLVDAIYSYVDDIVFFTALLCSDLMQHGKLVRQEFVEDFGKGAPKISEPDFSGPREKGLMPSDDNYRDWLNAFVTKAESRGQRDALT
jgi:hypothetical protein